MIIYNKDEKSLEIPNGLGNLSITINEGGETPDLTNYATTSYVDEEILKVNSEIETINEDIDVLEGRVIDLENNGGGDTTELDNRVTDIENRATELENKTNTLETDVDNLEGRVTNLENNGSSSGDSSNLLNYVYFADSGVLKKDNKDGEQVNINEWLIGFPRNPSTFDNNIININYKLDNNYIYNTETFRLISFVKEDLTTTSSLGYYKLIGKSDTKILTIRFEYRYYIKNYEFKVTEISNGGDTTELDNRVTDIENRVTNLENNGGSSTDKPTKFISMYYDYKLKYKDIKEIYDNYKTTDYIIEEVVNVTSNDSNYNGSKYYAKVISANYYNPDNCYEIIAISNWTSMGGDDSNSWVNGGEFKLLCWRLRYYDESMSEEYLSPETQINLNNIDNGILSIPSPVYQTDINNTLIIDSNKFDEISSYFNGNNIVLYYYISDDYGTTRYNLKVIACSNENTKCGENDYILAIGDYNGNVVSIKWEKPACSDYIEEINPTIIILGGGEGGSIDLSNYLYNVIENYVYFADSNVFRKDNINGEDVVIEEWLKGFVKDKGTFNKKIINIIYKPNGDYPNYVGETFRLISFVKEDVNTEYYYFKLIGKSDSKTLTIRFYYSIDGTISSYTFKVTEDSSDSATVKEYRTPLTTQQLTEIWENKSGMIDNELVVNISGYSNAPEVMTNNRNGNAIYTIENGEVIKTFTKFDKVIYTPTKDNDGWNISNEEIQKWMWKESFNVIVVHQDEYLGCIKLTYRYFTETESIVGGYRGNEWYEWRANSDASTDAICTIKTLNYE